MKHSSSKLALRYKAALRKHLKQRKTSSLKSVHRLGHRAVAAGMQPLDIARLHEQILIAELLPTLPKRRRDMLIRRAGSFFAAAITPIEKKHHSVEDATADLKKVVEVLNHRTIDLASCNHELSNEITQHKATEKDLKQSERHYAQLWEQSTQLQDQLRRLSRQALSVQEEERKKISRELHDIIAQTLTGINLRLAALKNEAGINLKGIDRNITRTQRMVEKSVEIIHQFARELRPAVLDDLGLIPALQSLVKNFTGRTGIRVRLTAFTGVEKLDATRRTVLFRVAQEAFTNIARHSMASSVHVNILKTSKGITMKIKDNGRGFDAKSSMKSGGGKRLGLLGMKERLEMVGGNFDIESSRHGGTTIRADILLQASRTRKRRSAKAKA